MHSNSGGCLQMLIYNRVLKVSNVWIKKPLSIRIGRYCYLAHSQNILNINIRCHNWRTLPTACALCSGCPAVSSESRWAAACCCAAMLSAGPLLLSAPVSGPEARPQPRPPPPALLTYSPPPPHTTDHPHQDPSMRWLRFWKWKGQTNILNLDLWLT